MQCIYMSGCKKREKYIYVGNIKTVHSIFAYLFFDEILYNFSIPSSVVKWDGGYGMRVLSECAKLTSYNVYYTVHYIPSHKK